MDLQVTPVVITLIDTDFESEINECAHSCILKLLQHCSHRKARGGLWNWELGLQGINKDGIFNSFSDG